MEKKICIHPDFKLNGRSYTKNSICELAIALIRDGEAHEKDLGRLILEWFDDNTYISLTTSGTTGTPKRIELSKQAMEASALATGEFFKLQPKDTALLCLPTCYIAGKMMFIRAVLLGLELDFVSPTKEPLKNTNKVYDFVAMVPLQVHHSITQIEQCKTLIVGGARLSDQTKDLLMDMMVNVYETYGMTETITHIAAKRIDEKYFTVLPHANISQDHRGCLVIEAPLIADYLIVTNDLVEMPNEIQFEWKGRYDNLVNSGGVKLIPEVIEQKLAEYIPYRFYVMGKSDKELGEKLVLVIEHKPYTLVPEAFDSLEKYEKPRETIFIEKFKETPNGKVLRKESIS
ncbi:AMP-binding protein [Paenimyroides aestuarii]|uniref:AMP-binding protein n=1 Tax=Paenimyroides aestuarii TaxID=2968490 RepID=A0ABY5NQ85_9FLAO|nr:AMP-binding protein [Paenimyroides aestuarii]UUV20681.1 AMP-binding protein [Paenimyroides aestuarii]